MHTVITHHCTGCELCLPPCPVDCINLELNSEFKKASNAISNEEIRELKKTFALFSRSNKENRTQRIEKLKEKKQMLFELKKNELLKR